MKTWKELLEAPRWAGIADEYGPYSQQVVSAREALIGTAWFAKVGQTLDAHAAAAVPAWEDALALLVSTRDYGPNGHLAAPSEIVIAAHEGFADHSWWERIRGELRRYYHYRFFIPRTLPKDQSDFLYEHLYEFESFLFMEIIYADFHKCTYFREMLTWIAVGRFPCGWEGPWPRGRMRVF